MAFMPLKEGNKWYYSNYIYPIGYDTTRLELREVIGMKTINGEAYSMVAIKHQPYYDSLGTSYITADTVFYRFEGSILFSINNEYNLPSKHPVGDFSLNTNQSYRFARPIGNNDSLHFIVTATRLSNDIMSFRFDDPRYVDEEYELTYQKGLGLIEMNYGNSMKLFKHELNK
jgi:hypothetical protein